MNRIEFICLVQITPRLIARDILVWIAIRAKYRLLRHLQKDRGMWQQSYGQLFEIISALAVERVYLPGAVLLSQRENGSGTKRSKRGLTAK